MEQNPVMVLVGLLFAPLLFADRMMRRKIGAGAAWIREVLGGREPEPVTR
jgi:hypothetical protein